jgi:hypothetical protein
MILYMTTKLYIKINVFSFHVLLYIYKYILRINIFFYIFVCNREFYHLLKIFNNLDY